MRWTCTVAQTHILYIHTHTAPPRRLFNSTSYPSISPPLNSITSWPCTITVCLGADLISLGHGRPSTSAEQRHVLLSVEHKYTLLHIHTRTHQTSIHTHMRRLHTSNYCSIQAYTYTNTYFLWQSTQLPINLNIKLLDLIHHRLSNFKSVSGCLSYLSIYTMYLFLSHFRWLSLDLAKSCFPLYLSQVFQFSLLFLSFSPHFTLSFLLPLFHRQCHIPKLSVYK